MAFIETDTGEIVTEVVSPRIEVHWDTEKQDGQIVFYTQRVVSMNGKVLAKQDLNQLVFVPIRELLPRSFDVVTGVNEEGIEQKISVPTSLMMGFIKSCFDTIYQEKVANYAPDPNAGTPIPESE